MRIAVHARLVEEAVFLTLRRRESRGEPSPGPWLHRRLERAYRLPEGPARNLRFERANAVAFGRLGLEAGLREVLERHPGLARGDGPVRVGPAPRRPKEGMELFLRRERDGAVRRSVLVNLDPSTLAEGGDLPVRLHREARKVADMLDPAFRWEPDPPESTPARRETVRIRYGVIWDAWTDGRLLRQGLPAPGDGRASRVAFAEAFTPLLGPEPASRAFDRAFASEKVTHPELLAWARNPAALPGAERAPVAAVPAFAASPGSPCPLCRFPTHDWYPDPAGFEALHGAAVQACRSDWTSTDGLCGQCALLLRGVPRSAAADPVARPGTGESPARTVPIPR